MSNGGASVVDDPEVAEREDAGLAGTGTRACCAGRNLGFCSHYNLLIFSLQKPFSFSSAPSSNLNRLCLTSGGGGHSTVAPTVGGDSQMDFGESWNVDDK